VTAFGWVQVTRRRRAPDGVDQYGEPVPGSWTEEAISERALFAPDDSLESTSPGLAQVVSSVALYWRGSHPGIVASDRLVVDGVEYAVIGRPYDWPKGLKVKIEAVEARGV
jgi:hypothetical protein